MSAFYLPTKNNLLKIKANLKLSKQGHELLEKKKFILTVEKNKYIKQQKKLKEEINKLFEEGYTDLNNASIDIGIDELINISDGIKTEKSIDIKYKSIMGVEIPSIVYDIQDLELSYGLYSTTISVDETILKFIQIKRAIIQLAEIDNILFRLNKSIQKVQKRSNALNDIIIPNNEKIAKQIEDILEEREREEFTRLKVMKKGK